MKITGSLCENAKATALTIALAATFAAGPLSARTIYEGAGVFPGDVIENTVTLTVSGHVTGKASVSFEVQSLPVSGTLRAFEYAQGAVTGLTTGQGRSSGPVEHLRFRASEYSKGDRSGPFVHLDGPKDISILSGQPEPIPIGGLVPVREVDRIRQGVPLFLALDAHALNFRSNREETAVIRVRDSISSDTEFVRLHETGADTGLFTGWINTQRASSTSQDGVISTTGYSRIDAVYRDNESNSEIIRSVVDVGTPEPAGIIFDARSGAPLDGVGVTIVDAATGLPASVLGDDVTSSYPSKIVSGNPVQDQSGRTYPLGKGEFRFPYVASGEYRMLLELPEGYSAPSLVSDSDIGAMDGNYIIGPGSRLEGFTVSPGDEVRFDIPVDRLEVGGVVRNANQEVVEIGDLFRYEVMITAPPTSSLDIQDTLPKGLRFIPGSLVIDGQPVQEMADPAGRGFFVPNVPVRPGTVHEMEYAAQVLPSVDPATLLRSTTVVTDALSGHMRMSGIHDLRVIDGFGMEDIVILGQVVDGGCGGQARGRDLSGIRILLESGDAVRTDEAGKFHFRDIAHRPRVVQVDETTLPRHSRLVHCTRNTRSAGSPISRFVDVGPGMMGRTEFHIEFDEEALAEERDFLALSDEFVVVDPSRNFDQTWLDVQEERKQPAILFPEDGYLSPSEAINVKVLRLPGQKADVLVNGKDVEAFRREEVMVSHSRKLNMETFSALRISEGRNRIEVIVTDRNGDEVLREAREVLMATVPAKAEIIASSSSLESDGRTKPVIRMRLTDADDIPLRPGLQVQVAVEQPFAFMPRTPRLSENASAMRPTNSIMETVRENGEVELIMAPVLETGTARFSISAPEGPIVEKVRISAAARPWVLVGLAEGTIAERHVRRHMRRDGTISNDLAGRVSLFAEGVIKGEWLMTLRIDTARDGKGDFDGIDPDKDYIVYGDRSYQEDASPSRFPLYLRLRKENAEYLVGDFELSVETQLLSLHRKMTGIRAVHENERYRVMAFAAQTEQRYVEDRIALDGTVGPYRLSRDDIVPNSEIVRLIQTSRIDASNEIASETLAAGRDYVMSHVNGEIILRRPVPAFAEDLSRNILFVSYETDEDIRAGVTAGIRAEMQVSEKVRAGATFIRERNSEGLGVDTTMAGIDVAWQHSDALTFRAEVVETQKDDGISPQRGTSAELRADYDDGDNLLSTYVRKQRGNLQLDGKLGMDRIDTAGTEFSIFIDAPTPESYEDFIHQRKERVGRYVEGFYLRENDQSHIRDTRKAEILLVEREKDLERAMGFTGYAEKNDMSDLHSIHFASRGAWGVDDMTFGMGLEYALNHKDPEVSDRLKFSMDYAATDNTTLFAAWEGASRRASGRISGVLAAGLKYVVSDGSDLIFGLANASGGGRSGQAIFAGAQNEITIGDRTAVELGLDAQTDLGASDIPIGLISGNPYIEKGFMTARAGMRHTRETWSTGVAAEHRWGDEGDRGNIRLSADGELSDAWSIGGDALLTVSTENGRDERDVELRFSAVNRGRSRDPITLLSLEITDEKNDAEKGARIYASAMHHRYLGDMDQVTMRYAVKHSSVGVAGRDFRDVIHLVGAEYRHDLGERLDIGIHAAGMVSAGSKSSRTSLGMSLGVTPFENGWLSAGYNIVGFREDDFSETGETDKGLFLQFRVKLDRNVVKAIFR